jgi:putative membrane protein
VDITTSATVVAQAGEASCEPDYRFTLANERTFLAWQRTSLGLLAAAVAAVQFLPELPIPGLRHMLGAMVGVLAMLTAANGLRRWTQADHAIRHGQPLPRPTAPVYLAWGLVVIGMITVALTLAATMAG